MTRTLRDFVGLHRGETAWLFGNGPSLSRFDFRTAGSLRCAVNDALRYVDGVKYCFANDGVLPWVDLYDPSHVLTIPPTPLNDAHQGGFLVSRVVCVGIDGGGGYGDSDMRSQASPDCIYATIRDRFISAATMLGIEIEFANSPAEIVSNDGLVRVLITQGIIAGGQAWVDGDIAALIPAEAAELITRGAAEPIRNFPRPQVEAVK